MIGFIRKSADSFRYGARSFLKHEAAGGIILICAAILALILDNSSFQPIYDGLLNTPMAFKIGVLSIEKPLLLWINDGLMAVFFALVGLEIKREIVEGELSDMRRASLPIVAAIGGMVVPALIYVAFNSDDPGALKGWAIPAATDIAFALGILALIGRRVPVALKVFLLALAIIDDLGAIVIIALFYTEELSLPVLGLASIGLILLSALNWRGVTKISPYVVIGLIIWVCVLKSGVHATLAGVVVALFVPLRAKDADGHSPLKRAEHGLAPWVALGIMPVFAFANAGVDLRSLSISDLFEGIPLGIAAGLFIGKQVGIMMFVWGSVRLGIARLPAGVGWWHVYGAALLAGIGFTMSLFIGTLAFASPDYAAAVRLGVLSGSILSGVFGYIVLRFLAKPKIEAAGEAGHRKNAEIVGSK